MLQGEAQGEVQISATRSLLTSEACPKRNAIPAPRSKETLPQLKQQPAARRVHSRYLSVCSYDAPMAPSLHEATVSSLNQAQQQEARGWWCRAMCTS